MVYVVYVLCIFAYSNKISPISASNFSLTLKLRNFFGQKSEQNSFEVNTGTNLLIEKIVYYPASPVYQELKRRF